MNTKLAAIALILATAAAVAQYPSLRAIGAAPPEVPAQQPLSVPAVHGRPRVEVAFVLDTTGSMGGLIQAAKEKIWSVATTLASGQPAPEIRMGLVAYRDRGDDYVTRVVDLAADLDGVYATLMDLRAQGGGDGPESVNQALSDAVHRLSWSPDPDTYRVIFLVGDAPPHMDYPNDVPWSDTVAVARVRGIYVNAIQCGRDGRTAVVWRRIAQSGAGSYLQVAQGGSAVAIATPYDERLARLSRELDRTRLYYGSDDERAENRRKMEAAEKVHERASVASRARRAAYAATESGAAGLVGGKELVEDVSSGRVDLDAIAPAELPAPLQSLSRREQRAAIDETAARRAAIAGEMKTLAAQREAYLREQVAEDGGAADSLDHGIYRAVREQAAGLGLLYEAQEPAY